MKSYEKVIAKRRLALTPLGGDASLDRESLLRELKETITENENYFRFGVVLVAVLLTIELIVVLVLRENTIAAGGCGIATGATAFGLIRFLFRVVESKRRCEFLLKLAAFLGDKALEQVLGLLVSTPEGADVTRLDSLPEASQPPETAAKPESESQTDLQTMQHERKMTPEPSVSVD